MTVCVRRTIHAQSPSPRNSLLNSAWRARFESDSKRGGKIHFEISPGARTCLAVVVLEGAVGILEISYWGEGDFPSAIMRAVLD